MLKNVTSMFIQALELGVVVPLGMLAGILLIRWKAWVYLLASVGRLKFLTMGAAVSLLGLNMDCGSMPGSAVELVIFPSVALANLMIVAILLKNYGTKACTYDQVRI